MNLRGCCFLIFFACLFLSSCLEEESIIQQTKKPNIVLIIADDLRYDALGVMQERGSGRFPWLNTPNLDQLAKEGTLFTNAFVTTSLCSPSRAAILTGQYNHINGVEGNQDHFNLPSYASVLQANGYETAYFGKWHMGRQSGKRPGFNNSYSFLGQGKYFDVPFEVNGIPTRTRGWVDEVSTDYLIDYLQKKHNKPFCYVLGFKSSHGPWDDTPSHVASLYEGLRPSIVPNMSVPAIYLGKEGSIKPKFGHINYHRIITAMDEQIGRIMNALKEEGLDKNTMVIFMSDNGFYREEHGLGDKRTAYEESLRIPLIIKNGLNPSKKPVIDELVLNIDIAPTILHFAGVQTPNIAMQGKSIIPLLNNESQEWRESFVYRYKMEPNFGPQLDITALRTKDHKLILYTNHKEWTELFNLQRDPYEIANTSSNKELLDYYLALLEKEKAKVLLP